LEPVRFALVGIGGIGSYHRAVMHALPEIELVAAADRFLDTEVIAPQAAEMREWGVPLYHDIWEMLDAVDVEAVVLAVPHHWHGPYTLGCLDRGLHVLVEKPLTVNIAEARAVVEKSAATGLHVAVDFQYVSYPHSKQLKRMICDGDLGEITEVVGVLEWMRLDSYYSRSAWSGKRYPDGLPCFDGVLMNQGVHVINSALGYGTRAPGHAAPVVVEAEMYAMHKDIEVEDLAAVRAQLDSGATMCFYATTCCTADYRTSVDIVGTKGSASWDPERATVRLDGQEEITLTGDADRDAIHKNLAARIRGEAQELHAPAVNALPATHLIDCAYLSAGDITRIPWESARNLRSFIDSAADERRLFAEMPQWPKPGRRIEAAAVVSFEKL